MRVYTLNDRLRLSDVDRWHMVATSRRQSVAEHTYNVVMIATRMAALCGLGQSGVVKMTEYALMHDVDETITGDISPPAKHFMRHQGIDPNDLVKSNIGTHMATIRWDLKLMLKAADLVESVVWLRQWGVGAHSKSVLLDLEQQLANHMETIRETDNVIYDAVVKTLAEMADVNFEHWDGGYTEEVADEKIA